MIEQFVSARNVSTPLIAIRTSDPQLTIGSVLEREAKAETSIFVWDCINGIKGLTESAKKFAQTKIGDDDTTNAVSALEMAQKLPDASILFLSNGQFGVAPTVNPNWVQAVWNLREPYKRTGSTLVILCPDITLPAELSQDVMVLDEPLPSTEQLKQIVLRTLESAGETDPEPEMIDKAVDATCGLAAFPAEQVCAMSLYRDKETKKVGLKLNDLWFRKKQMVESTPGLTIYRGEDNFEDIGGLANIKDYIRRLVAGKRSPRCFAFLDEGEKMFAGSTGNTSDSSGVSQGFLGSFLSFMQDTGSSGSLLVGVPGAGKSQIAKAAGNIAKVPVVSFDLNAMKDSLVGSSEARLRNALKVMNAISQGRCYFLMTCNRIASLPPELKRRFGAIFFFDLPSAEERKAIWSIYLKKYDQPLDTPLPDDSDWTGGDIKKCCYLAFEELCCPLIEAALYITPVGKTSGEEINALRAQAHGKYLSASNPGFYRHEAVAAMQGASRAIASIPEE